MFRKYVLRRLAQNYSPFGTRHHGSSHDRMDGKALHSWLVSYDTDLVGKVFDGMTWTMFKPSWPAVLPTPETFLDSLIATRSEIVYCVPAFIEVSARFVPQACRVVTRNPFLQAWAQNPDNMEKIRTLRAMVRLIRFLG